MQVSKKKYKKGGLFGNSQEKFSHMAGAERGFDRKRLRELRRAKRKGESLSGKDAQDLQYMKAVRGDRIKKGIMGGALLGAGAIAAGPAIAAKGGLKGIMGAVKGKGASGLAGEAAGKGGLKGLLGKFGKAKKVQKALADSGVFRGTDSATANSGQYGGAPSTPIDQMELQGIQDFDMSEEQGFKRGGKYKVKKKSRRRRR